MRKRKGWVRSVKTRVMLRDEKKAGNPTGGRRQALRQAESQLSPAGPPGAEHGARSHQMGALLNMA